MIDLKLTTAVLGLGLAATILVLVRRDSLHPSHGVFWIVVAVSAGLLGSWPVLLDRLAFQVGIAYSPTLLLLAAVMVLLIKALLGDIAQTRMERQIRRLNQRIAIVEAEKRRQQETPSSVSGGVASDRRGLRSSGDSSAGSNV